MNWLLIAVLVILLGNAILGRKAGLVKIIFSLCSMMLAILLTVIINPVVNDVLLGNEKLYSAITNRMEKTLNQDETKTSQEGKEEGGKEDNAIVGDETAEKDENAKTEQETYVEKLKLPQVLKDALIKNNSVDDYKNMAIDNVKQSVNKCLTGVVLNAISFVITFVVISIILWVLSFSLKLISKLPVLHQINKNAGMCVGLLQGLIMVWIFFLVITTLGGTTFGQNALKMVEESSILSFIYDNNILLKTVTSVTKGIF